MGKIIDWFVGFTNKNWRHGGCVLRDLRRARDQGILFIEAAFLLPVAVVFLLGVVEVGNWYYQGLRLGNLAQNLATGVQQDPSISPHNLYRLTVSTSSLPEVNRTGGAVPVNCPPETCEIQGLSRTLVASTTPLSQGSVQSASSSDWSNPWENDSDPSNDRQPYYVGVAVSYPRTSLFSRLFSTTSRTSRWSSVVVNPAIQPRVTTEVRFFRFKTWDNDELERYGGYRRVQIGTTSVNESVPAESLMNGPTPFVTDEVAAQHGSSDWGLRCRQENGWVPITCSLQAKSGDRDLRAKNNGCFSDEGEENGKGRIYLGCMKSIVD